MAKRYNAGRNPEPSMTRYRPLALVVVLLAGLAPAAWAQEQPAPAQPVPPAVTQPAAAPEQPITTMDEATGTVPTFYKLFMFNAPLNTAILVLSVIAVFMFL